MSEKKDYQELGLKMYAVLAYAENILDIIDDVKPQAPHLTKHFNNYYKSAKTFYNRIQGKNSEREHKFLEHIFKDEADVIFNEYRNELQETINYIINIHPGDYEKLKVFRTYDFSNSMILVNKDMAKDEELIVMTKKEACSLIRDGRLSTDKPINIIKKWLHKNQI